MTGSNAFIAKGQIIIGRLCAFYDVIITVIATIRIAAANEMISSVDVISCQVVASDRKLLVFRGGGVEVALGRLGCVVAIAVEVEDIVVAFYRFRIVVEIVSGVETCISETQNTNRV